MTVTDVIKIRDKNSLIDIIEKEAGKDIEINEIDGVSQDKIEDYTLDQLKSYIISEIISAKQQRTNSANSAKSLPRIKNLKRRSRIEMAKAKMKRRVEAIISEVGTVSTRDSTSPSEDGKPFEFKQFGNGDIGFMTAKVVFDVPMMYPELLLDQLAQAVFIPHIQSGNNIIEGKPVKMYSIVRTGIEYTQDDIESLRKKQEVILK